MVLNPFFCLFKIDAAASNPVERVHNHQVVSAGYFVLQAAHGSNFNEQSLRNLALGFVQVAQPFGALGI